MNLQDRLARAEQAAANMPDSRTARAEAAFRRIQNGTATWADFKLIGGMQRGLDSCVREHLFRCLPLALDRPGWKEPGGGGDFWSNMMEIAVVPPGGAFSSSQQSTWERINTAWSNDANPLERLKWALSRLILGEDKGLKLRKQLWRVDRRGSVAVSEAVLKDAQEYYRQLPVHEVIGETAYDRLADTAINVLDERRWGPYAAVIERYGSRMFFDASLLEVAILGSSEVEPTWLGVDGRDWLLGQYRSDPVTAGATSDAVLAEVVKRAKHELDVWCSMHAPARAAYSRAESRR